MIERLRQDAFKIFDKCLKAADPEEAVRKFVHVSNDSLLIAPDIKISLSQFDRIVVVGAGKASAMMCRALEGLLGARLDIGLLSVKYGHALNLERTRIIEAGHPIPDEAGLKATNEIIALLSSLGHRDLVFSCISGGGSALLPAPVDGVTLENKQLMTSLLLEAGADIHEINAVRKHLSVSKGGGLMKFAYPAFVINLILSDVVGDDPSVIASGPFSPDRTTCENAMQVINRLDLEDVAPRSVMKHFRKILSGEAPETPKTGDPIFSHVRNVVIGSNLLSLNAGKYFAQSLGYNSLVLSSFIEGETSQTALFHAAIAKEIIGSANPVAPPACILSGGETTVKVSGNGLGGRNQHFVLSILKRIEELPDCVFFSAGSDGTDGPTDAAGAIADSFSFQRAVSIGLDPDTYLSDFDSYHFFMQLGDLVITGPTLTNVMDIRIALVGGSTCNS
ncbi:MAG: glycerate kinase [Deltaproteobacteria bacterium]|nr:glycerate kinase [Deltaproteobacteria bacterium]